MKQSAGILLYRVRKKQLEVFLVHPGGPFWKNKDTGAWSVPKGEFNDEEDGLAAAKREFTEETGQAIEGKFHALTPVKMKSGKMVYAWAVEGDADAENITSNEILIEWPPKTGKKISIPEVDRAGWFDLATAREKINPAQENFIQQLEELHDQ